MPTLKYSQIELLPYGTIVKVLSLKGQIYRFARTSEGWWTHTADRSKGISTAVMVDLARKGRVGLPDLPAHLLPIELRVEALDQPLPPEWDGYSGMYLKTTPPKAKVIKPRKEDKNE